MTAQEYAATVREMFPLVPIAERSQAAAAALDALVALCHDTERENERLRFLVVEADDLLGRARGFLDRAEAAERENERLEADRKAAALSYVGAMEERDDLAHKLEAAEARQLERLALVVDAAAAEARLAQATEALEWIDRDLTTVEGDNIPQGETVKQRVRWLARSTLAAVASPETMRTEQST